MSHIPPLPQLRPVLALEDLPVFNTGLLKCKPDMAVWKALALAPRPAKPTAGSFLHPLSAKTNPILQQISKSHIPLLKMWRHIGHLAKLKIPLDSSPSPCIFLSFSLFLFSILLIKYPYYSKKFNPVPNLAHSPAWQLCVIWSPEHPLGIPSTATSCPPSKPHSSANPTHSPRRTRFTLPLTKIMFSPFSHINTQTTYRLIYQDD